MVAPVPSDTAEPLSIERSVFDTRGLAPAQQAAAWTETIGSIFDVELRSTGAAGYAARVEGTLVGSNVIGRVEAGTQMFRRSAFRSYADGLEGYVVQSFARGSVRFADDLAPLTAPGQLLAIDLTQPLETINSDFELVSLFLPRKKMEHGRSSGPHLQATAPESALGRMTAEFLLGLERSLARMDPQEAATAMDAAMDLVAECFRGELRRSMTQTSHRIALLETVRAHIAQRLDVGAPVEIDELARWAGCSRATLYRVFEPIGGIAAYVRKQRLARVLRDLASTTPALRALSIGEIASRHGFESDAHFSRLFKSVFGLSPSEARHHLFHDASHRSADGAEDRRYELWMKLVH